MTYTGKEVAKFGVELWERLNGKEEGVLSFAELLKGGQQKVPQTAEMGRLAEMLMSAQSQLQELTSHSESIKLNLRMMRRDGIPLPKEDVQELKRLDLKVKEQVKKIKILTLNLDMEKICAYVQKEVETSTEVVEQRTLIAEVSLIDKQLATIMSGLQFDTSFSAPPDERNQQEHKHSAEIPSNNIPKETTDASGNSNNGAHNNGAFSRWNEDAVILVDEDELNLITAVVSAINIFSFLLWSTG